MTALLEDKDIYLSSFAACEKKWKASDPVWLAKVRQAAIDRFAALGFPTLDDEEWRSTPLSALTRIPFQLASGPIPVPPTEVTLPLTLAGKDWTQLLFVNGQFVRLLPSTAELAPGAVVCSLAQALRNGPAALKDHLGRHADGEDNPFVALNTAFLDDGAVIQLPKNCVNQQPIHLIFLSMPGSEPTACHPRNLIVLEANSQATVVESYLSAGEGDSFSNAVTEVVLGEGAHLDYYKVQREGQEAFHIHTLQVQQARASHFSSHAFTLGGRLSRSDSNAVLDGEGCECTLNGLYLGSGEQLIDNHTRIDHAKPHCASHELYKGILDNKAHGVFNGKIHVHPDAQKTDAKQTNQTLLLSEDAIINTKPQLEIYADDVKCTHGATVGQLDALALFYLRSRGLGLAEARALLVYAFANDIIGRVKIESLRAELEQLLRSPVGSAGDGRNA